MRSLNLSKRSLRKRRTDMATDVTIVTPLGRATTIQDGETLTIKVRPPWMFKWLLKGAINNHLEITNNGGVLLIDTKVTYDKEN
jgi:hypothetical protein